MSFISIVIKLSNGTQHSLDLPAVSGTRPKDDLTVSDFKRLASSVVNIPAEAQRVVYRGKVLKDADTLQAAGVEAGVSIHIVRGQSTPAAAPGVAPVTTPAASNVPSVPQPSTTPSATAPPAANPYAQLFASQPPAASGGGDMDAMMSGMMGNMGGFGQGFAGGQDMQRQLMNNPQMMQMAINMMTQNPQMMRTMMASHPMLQGMPEQQRQMMFDMMSNPQMLQMMMGAGTGAGAGAAGGLGMAPPMGAAAQQQTNPQEQYREQLQQLAAMGFPNEQANIAALRMSQGNIEFAIERLLGGM